MRSPIHPINDTKRLLEQIQAFLPTMLDRRRPETHQDARQALFGAPDVGRHGQRSPDAPRGR
jgi:hypothetical protein